MDLGFSTEHEKFRSELRAWLSDNLEQSWSESLRDRGNDEHALIELRRQWQRRMYQGGYLGMRWPAEWGGRGATEVEEAILAQEIALADAPPILNALGLGLCAPALIHHGSEEQRRRLPA